MPTFGSSLKQVAVGVDSTEMRDMLRFSLNGDPMDRSPTANSASPHLPTDHAGPASPPPAGQGTPQHRFETESKTPSLTQLLRTGTQDQHEAAEGHGFHRIVFGAEGPQRAREAFVESLGQHLRVQEIFEPRLIGLAGVTPGVGAILKPYHRHLPALRDDLEVLGASDEHRRALPATLRFMSKIESYATDDGLALLGVWYVFEGATNGGTIIGKRIRDVLGLPDDRGTRFTNPHGPLVRPRWTEWKAGVDALQLEEARREAILDAARETFKAVGEILGQVVESMPPVAAGRS